MLKAKLARYRAQLLEPTTKGGPAGVGFEVQKAGDARVALIGFPSVGKVKRAATNRPICVDSMPITVYFANQNYKNDL